MHIIHEYANDFYGQELRIAILGYIRPELNYTGIGRMGSEMSRAFPSFLPFFTHVTHPIARLCSSLILDDLVEDIRTDIRVAQRSLNREPYLEQRRCPFFSSSLT